MRYGKKKGKKKKSKIDYNSPFKIGKFNFQGEGGGRPPIFENEQDLRAEVTAYFERCHKTSTLPNKAGLCVFIHVSRDTYNEYKKKFPDTLKVAEGFMEDAWVQRLKYQGATGPIFYLKNAFKQHYKDKIENSVDHSGSVIYLPEPPKKK